MNERALRQLAHVPRLAIQASSSETDRDTNRTIILELIRLAGAVSRADLARLSGLQKSTVSAIVEELLLTRWICEGETGFSKHHGGLWHGPSTGSAGTGVATTLQPFYFALRAPAHINDELIE
jgi:hypothetical protein